MITPEEFSLWQRFLIDLSGVHITSDKAYLFENRLLPLAREFNCDGIHALYEKAVADPDGPLVGRIIEIMTTHETSFFRNEIVFEWFSEYVQDWLYGVRRGKRSAELKILSAGCSTGEEPWSIAMVLARKLKRIHNVTPSILGCDIAPETLARAEEGIYHRTDRIPEQDIARYFEPVEDRPSCLRVGDTLRQWVRFQRINLMEIEKLEEDFDIIFCRNVAIYFDINVRRRLFETMARKLLPGGVLLLGSSESMLGVTNAFERYKFGKIYYYGVREGHFARV